jgi:hypothetical protein
MRPCPVSAPALRVGVQALAWDPLPHKLKLELQRPRHVNPTVGVQALACDLIPALDRLTCGVRRPISHTSGMYRWRQLNERQRQQLLEFRKRQARPWHSPPHYGGSQSRYLLSAACYEHRPQIANSAERMASFCDQLMAVLNTVCERVAAWCVLPNHYHVLVHTRRLTELLSSTASSTVGLRGPGTWKTAGRAGKSGSTAPRQP